MSEDNKSGNAPIPPRLTIKAPGQTGGLGTRPLETPSTMAPPPNPSVPPELNQVAGLKKKTARISLDQVTAESGAPATVSGVGIASKTIRLAPAMMGQGAVTPLPPVGKALSGMLISDDAKRKTSRISLDSVLPQLEAAASAGGDAGPKTIRIKRPTFSSSTNLPTMAPVEPAPVVTPVEPNAKSQTARVDIPPEAMVTEAQQTQKKTIKIRRAEGGSEAKTAPRSISVARAEAALERATQVQVATPHWSFVMVAAAAVIVMCVMLYALMAQAYPSLGWSL